jgi:hypothetical protein
MGDSSGLVSYIAILSPPFTLVTDSILLPSFIAFCTDIGSTSPTDVLVLDKSFRISNKHPGILSRYHHHITLSNNFRRIEIKGSKRQVDEWREGIRKVQEESPWVKNHRFGSFAPIRYDSKVKWFVDAEGMESYIVCV